MNNIWNTALNPNYLIFSKLKNEGVLLSNFPLFEQQNLMFLLYHEQNILLSANKYLMFAQTVTRARIMKI